MGAELRVMHFAKITNRKNVALGLFGIGFVAFLFFAFSSFTPFALQWYHSRRLVDAMSRMELAGDTASAYAEFKQSLDYLVRANIVQHSLVRCQTKDERRDHIRSLQNGTRKSFYWESEEKSLDINVYDWCK